MRVLGPLIAITIAIVAVGGFTVAYNRSKAPAADADAAIEVVVRNYLAKHPEEIEKIVRDYVVKHPELMHAAILDFVAKRAAANNRPSSPSQATPDRSAAVKNNAVALFTSVHQVTLGNPQGDVTLVEFFDYNCGFCKRALADLIGLMQAEPKLRVVLKEFPVLGQASNEAARVAIAVRMQDATGARYLEFHQRLLSSRGPINTSSAVAIAREIGFDIARLEQDMASDEVRVTLEENFNLAKALGINGTPSYVIGENVVIGAVGLPALRDKVVAERH